MMYFESVIQFVLSDTTTLTGMVVSFACLFIHTPPVLTVIREPSTFPAWTFLAVYICGLPITHAITATKIMFFYICVLSVKLLTAPITIQHLTAPTQKNAPAFLTASYLLYSVEAIWFYCKGFAAHRTIKSWGSRIRFSISIMARSITEPKPRRVEGLAAWFSMQVFSTGRALNNHKSIIPYLVACQNLSRRGRAIEISPAYCAVTLERMSTAFPELEIRRL